jgi:hypothetical protein
MLGAAALPPFGFPPSRQTRPPRIALCRTIKDAASHAEDRINQKIARGLRPMIIPHWARQASSLNPHLGPERHPINQAVRLALEKVGLQLHLLQNGGDKNRARDKKILKESLSENRSY